MFRICFWENKKKQGIFDRIFFFQNIFHKMAKILHKRITRKDYACDFQIKIKIGYHEAY